MLPQGAMPSVLKNPPQGITAAGCLMDNCSVLLRAMVLPKFSHSRKIEDQWAYVFNFNSHYAKIYGQGFMLC